jgi:hypothetical protein
VHPATLSRGAVELQAMPVHLAREAIGLRWSDLGLDEPAPHMQVRRAIVRARASGRTSRAAPPLNVSDSDAATGLAILDEALAAADTFLG